MSECKYHDPFCPCQDGDACHYEDCGDTKAWDPRYVLAAHIADLTSKLAEAERERDSATFDKARMLDERQIFLKGMDELRAEVARLKSNLQALEDEKNTYIDYVGDALGQDNDRETLWDAAQRVLSDRDRTRCDLESAEARLRELREWITAAHHLPLCAKWVYALDDQMQIVPALVHDAECTCGRDSALAKSGEP